jgi:hypothetical protein
MVVGDLSSNQGAGKVESYGDRLEQVVTAILARAEGVAPAEANAVETELDYLRSVWGKEAAHKASLQFEDQRNSQNALLIRYTRALEHEDFDFSLEAAPWATPESMRDVDAVTPLRQVPPRKDSTNV